MRGAVSGRRGRGVEGRPGVGGWIAGDWTEEEVGSVGVWRKGLTPGEGCGVGRRPSVSVLMGIK